MVDVQVGEIFNFFDCGLVNMFSPAICGLRLIVSTFDDEEVEGGGPLCSRYSTGASLYSNRWRYDI